MDKYSYDIGPMVTQNEPYSLPLRINRNCPWNRCFFCHAYKGQKFEYRSVEELKRDIDTIEALAESILRQGISETIARNQEVYGEKVPSELRQSRLRSLYWIAHWHSYGARDLFLQDSDAMIMRTGELLEVLRYLKEKFPTIKRVSSYARAKTCFKKSPEALKELREAGLSALHIGLESGCDEVLDFMKKGVTAREHTEAGRRIVEAGISLNLFIMPGLGGKRWSEKHTTETARVINEINPHFIRVRSLCIFRDTPLYERHQSGEFEPLNDDEMVDEIQKLVESLTCISYFSSNQMSNILWDTEGKLPQERERILATIRNYKSMPLWEKLIFKLNKYVGPYPVNRNTGPYPSENYLYGLYGRYGFDFFDPRLERLIQEAYHCVEKETAKAEEKVEEMISAIKAIGVP